MRKYRGYEIGIIFLQMVILIICFKISGCDAYRPESVRNEMVSRNIEQQNNGMWYIDENSGVSDGKIFLYGPYTKLEKGSYTVAVVYETDWNQSMDIYSKNNAKHLFSDNRISLGSEKNIEEAKIRVTQDIDDFEVRLYYSGKGYVNVYDVSIIRNNEEQKENFLIIAVILAVLDVYLFVIKRSRFIGLCPIFAGIVTGIAISMRGGYPKAHHLLT